MIKKKSLNILDWLNKEFDFGLKVGGILRGYELDAETDPNGDQYGDELVWYFKLVEENDEYYLVDCDENGNYDRRHICKECSFQYLTKDDIDYLVRDMQAI